MNFALAFVLLIGISCQIGRGDCAPDGLYESFSSMVSGAFSATQDTYHSVIDHLPSLKDYLVSPADSLSSYLPTIPSIPSVSDSITSGLSNIKESAENLGSDAGNYLKNGASQISDAVN